MLNKLNKKNYQKKPALKKQVFLILYYLLSTLLT